MSHFTHLKTKMTEKTFLKQALQDLGLKYHEGDLEIRGHDGQRARVELKVRLSGHDIGFVKVGDAYELVADWMVAAGFKREQFLHRLTQRYAYHATRAKLEEQGFSLASEEVEENGEIRLVLRRMV